MKLTKFSLYGLVFWCTVVHQNSFIPFANFLSLLKYVRINFSLSIRGLVFALAAALVCMFLVGLGVTNTTLVEKYYVLVGFLSCIFNLVRIGRWVVFGVKISLVVFTPIPIDVELAHSGFVLDLVTSSVKRFWFYLFNAVVNYIRCDSDVCA